MSTIWKVKWLANKNSLANFGILKKMPVCFTKSLFLWKVMLVIPTLTPKIAVKYAAEVKSLGNKKVLVALVTVLHVHQSGSVVVLPLVLAKSEIIHEKLIKPWRAPRLRCFWLTKRKM